jgi:hypothetical protein
VLSLCGYDGEYEARPEIVLRPVDTEVLSETENTSRNEISALANLHGINTESETPPEIKDDNSDKGLSRRGFVCLESTSPFGSLYHPDTTISQLFQGKDRKIRGPDRGNPEAPCPMTWCWD